MFESRPKQSLPNPLHNYLPQSSYLIAIRQHLCVIPLNLIKYLYDGWNRLLLKSASLYFITFSAIKVDGQIPHFLANKLNRQNYVSPVIYVINNLIDFSRVLSSPTMKLNSKLNIINFLNSTVEYIAIYTHTE